MVDGMERANTSSPSAPLLFGDDGFPVTAQDEASSATRRPMLAWYRWSDKREPFRCWEHLKLKLLNRFQPSQDGNLYEQFLKIKQDGTAREYVTLFETLAAQLEGISENILEGTFIKGLKQDLRHSVRVLQPKGLSQTIELALMIDETRSGSSGETGKGSGKPTPARNSVVAPKLSGTTATGGIRPGGGTTKQPFRRMTESEYADKKAKLQGLGSNYKRSGLEFYYNMILVVHLEPNILYGPLFVQRMTWDPGIT
nr:ankyrin repeat-containing protein [Tanacetum cinerariifolium]